jgi:hypothetical protein
MRRARLEGRHIGRRPIEIDRVAVLRDRNGGEKLFDPVPINHLGYSSMGIAAFSSSNEAIPIT